MKRQREHIRIYVAKAERTRPRTTVRNSDVQVCIVWECNFWYPWTILFSKICHMLGLSGTLSYAVFVYLCICIFVFARLTHGNIIFDTLEQSSFQKYAICWVFPALGNALYLCICVFVYLYLCIFVWDTWEYQFRYPWTKSFQKMYGLYGLKHHKVERLKRWRTNKQTDRQNFLL